jgi:hypothetical protein
MTPPPRKPHPRLVDALRPHMGGAAPENAFVAQVGGNPALAVAALPIGLITVFIPTGTVTSLVIASGLSLLFLVWVLAVFLPMKSRVVGVSKVEIIVLDASKLRFQPKRELRRLPRTHQFGEVKGFLTGRVDLGGGERGWVFKGYAGTIDAIDGRYAGQVPLGGGLPPRQRWSDRVKKSR